MLSRCGCRGRTPGACQPSNKQRGEKRARRHRRTCTISRNHAACNEQRENKAHDRACTHRPAQPWTAPEPPRPPRASRPRRRNQVQKQTIKIISGGLTVSRRHGLHQRCRACHHRAGHGGAAHRPIAPGPYCREKLVTGGRQVDGGTAWGRWGGRWGRRGAGVAGRRGVGKQEGVAWGRGWCVGSCCSSRRQGRGLRKGGGHPAASWTHPNAAWSTGMAGLAHNAGRAAARARPALGRQSRLCD